MFRVFSGSCLSMEDLDTINRPNLVQRPHVLGPGVDFFTEDGEPLPPQPGFETLQKVFSGSALDLNAMNSDLFSDEEGKPASPAGAQRVFPVSSIVSQITSETEKERARAAKSKVHVLVIGDASYIASHVVVKLLEAGYSVRLTVPAIDNQQQADLYSLGRDVAQRVTIHTADMTSSAALRDVIRGCRYVVHCGCPASAFKGRSAVECHTEAVQALFDGIRIAGKATVKRVVLMGAATSVFHVSDPDPLSGAFDETCWNTTVTPDADPIPFARLTFEKEAWRLRQMMGVELVVLLPSATIGPSRTTATSEANSIVEELANAPSYFPFCPDLAWNFVDIRDVADASVRALESSDAKDQRIIISNACISFPEISKVLKRQFPHLSPPTRTASKLLTLCVCAFQPSRRANMRFLWRNLGVRKPLDNRRAVQELGVIFTPIEETVSAIVDQLIRAGEVPAAPEAKSAGNRKTIAAVLGVTSICAVAGGAAYWLLRHKHAS